MINILTFHMTLKKKKIRKKPPSIWKRPITVCRLEKPFLLKISFNINSIFFLNKFQSKVAPAIQSMDAKSFFIRKQLLSSISLEIGRTDIRFGPSPMPRKWQKVVIRVVLAARLRNVYLWGNRYYYHNNLEIRLNI